MACEIVPESAISSNSNHAFCPMKQPGDKLNEWRLNRLLCLLDVENHIDSIVEEHHFGVSVL